MIEAEPALTEDHRAGSFHPPTLEMLAPFGVAREKTFGELRRIAADRERARDYLVKSSMIWSVRRAAEIT